jgi:Flp pilus assembly protein TadG
VREPARRLSRLRAVGRGDDSGASALEMSIVAPGLVLLIFFGIQSGLYFYGRTVAVQSAREGVSLVRLAKGEADRMVLQPLAEDKAEAFAVAVGRESLLDPVAEVTYDEAAGLVEVRVTGRVISLVPGLDLEVSEAVSGTIERFEGDP